MDLCQDHFAYGMYFRHIKAFRDLPHSHRQHQDRQSCSHGNYGDNCICIFKSRRKKYNECSEQGRKSGGDQRRCQDSQYPRRIKSKTRACPNHISDSHRDQDNSRQKQIQHIHSEKSAGDHRAGFDRKGHDHIILLIGKQDPVCLERCEK